MSYDELIDAYAQNLDEEVLPPEEFFGEDPLEIQERDNDLVSETAIFDQYSTIGTILEGSNKPANKR